MTSFFMKYRFQDSGAGSVQVIDDRTLSANKLQKYI